MPHLNQHNDQAAGRNPYRDDYLFWYTQDGYIIAQDILSQYEYIQSVPCPNCDGNLRVVAHLNRAGQGLSEMVTICNDCHYPVNFIFDISNEVYQHWWKEQLGALYIVQYDGDPRQPHSPD